MAFRCFVWADTGNDGTQETGVRSQESEEKQNGLNR